MKNTQSSPRKTFWERNQPRVALVQGVVVIVALLVSLGMAVQARDSRANELDSRVTTLKSELHEQSNATKGLTDETRRLREAIVKLETQMGDLKEEIRRK